MQNLEHPLTVLYSCPCCSSSGVFVVAVALACGASIAADVAAVAVGVQAEVREVKS